MNTVGKNIKQLRLKRLWIQADVAEKLNLSVPAYSKIETGLTDINIPRLNQLAELFGVTPENLLSDDIEDHSSERTTLIKQLKETIAQKEEEIDLLQKKVIELYEEIQHRKK